MVAQSLTRTSKSNQIANPKDIESQVKSIIVEKLGVNPEQVVVTANFVDDLGAGELDMTELLLAFEEQFQITIPDGDAERIKTVRDACAYIRAHIKQH